MTAKAWKVGDKCWIVDGDNVFTDTVTHVDEEPAMIGILDEVSGPIMWIDFGNAFADSKGALLQAAEWRVELCERNRETWDLYLKEAEERLAALKAVGS